MLVWHRDGRLCQPENVSVGAKLVCVCYVCARVCVRVCVCVCVCFVSSSSPSHCRMATATTLDKQERSGPHR